MNNGSLDERILRARQERRDQHLRQYAALANSPIAKKRMRMYYPGCGDDDAPVEAFPHAEIIMIDHDYGDIAALQSKSLPKTVTAAVASADAYDPGSVDALLLQGADHDMPLDQCIAAVSIGGFVICGDTSNEMRIQIHKRPDMELVGIIRSVQNGNADDTYEFSEGKEDHLS